MDGVVIWIYAIFLFIVCENKNLREINQISTFTLSTIIKQLSLTLLGRVEVFK